MTSAGYIILGIAFICIYLLFVAVPVYFYFSKKRN